MGQCYRGSGPNGPLAAILAEHFIVYTYDRRGRGDSGDIVPYAVDREVEDIEALIAEAGGSGFARGCGLTPGSGHWCGQPRAGARSRRPRRCGSG